MPTAVNPCWEHCVATSGAVDVCGGLANVSIVVVAGAGETLPSVEPELPFAFGSVAITFLLITWRGRRPRDSYRGFGEHVFQIDALDGTVIDDGADDGSVPLQRDDGRIGCLADLLTQRGSDGIVACDLNGAAGRGLAGLDAVTDLACQFRQIACAPARTDDEHVNLIGAEDLIERLVPWNDDGSGHGRQPSFGAKSTQEPGQSPLKFTPRPAVRSRAVKTLETIAASPDPPPHLIGGIGSGDFLQIGNEIVGLTMATGR